MAPVTMKGLTVYYIGEWHLSVWVARGTPDTECLLLGRQVEASLRAWADELPETLPMGHRVARTEVDS